MSNATHPLARLLAHAKSHRSRVWLASLCSILNKVFDLAPPLLIGAAVDIVVQREASLLADLGVSSLDDQLWVLAAVTVAVWALESAFEYAYATLWRNLAQTLQHELRLDAYRHVQRLEVAYFEERSSGELMSVLNDDINQLERFLDGGANDILQVLTTVVVVGVIFFTAAPQVAWLAFLPIPLILYGSFLFQRRIAPRYAEVRNRVGLLNSRLQGNLQGIATIKSFTAEEHEAERVREESLAYQSANQLAIRLSAAFSPLIRMVIVLGFVATLVVGGKLVFAGTISVGIYSVLVFLTQRLLWPLTRLGATFDLFQRAMASTERVLDLLDTEAHIEEGGQPLPVETVRGAIEIDTLSFAYRGREPLFSNLSLTFEEAQTTAVVGATGSGKSSLVKLLLRFYEPSSGEIRLDGHPIHTLRLADLRRATGLVSQDVFLFYGTVRENIAYGRRDASDAEIEEAARTAEAHDFIMALPQGYDTLVGERGQKLSGGQRQRISIARVLLKDPPVLILDEATSAVDNETEAAIQRSLERIAVGRTTIVIAHRLSTIRNADQIYVLDQGNLVESGRHEALLGRKEGIYARLWKVQTGES